jgi:hypothetical protein
VAGVYGKRFCGACGYCYEDCCCDGGGEFFEGGGYIEGMEMIEGAPVIEGGAVSGGCPDGNCSSTGTLNRAVPGRMQRSPAWQQAMARQQAATSRTAGQANRPSSPAVVDRRGTDKFYRQASRLPRSPQPLRR